MVFNVQTKLKENFGLFTLLEYDSLILKIHFISLWGGFSWLPIEFLWCLVVSPSVQDDHKLLGFLDEQTSLAPTPVSKFVRHTFGFIFCQGLWDLTKRRDNIVVADMVADMMADTACASSKLCEFKLSAYLMFHLTGCFPGQICVQKIS